MLFYEMEFISKNNLEKSTKDEQFAMNNKIKRDMCYLNGKIAENIVFAISQIVKDHIVLCAGVKDGNKDNCRDKVCECIRKLEIDAKLTECNEITMTRFFSLIDLSSRHSFSIF